MRLSLRGVEMMLSLRGVDVARLLTVTEKPTETQTMYRLQGRMRACGEQKENI